MQKLEELKEWLGDEYVFNRSMTIEEINRLQKNPFELLGEITVATLIAGMVKIEAVLYKENNKLLLGYEVYVKDTPKAQDWIGYDSPEEEVTLEESEMLQVLDKVVRENGLSYTECCLEQIVGKEAAKLEENKELQM